MEQHMSQLLLVKSFSARQTPMIWMRSTD